MKKLCSELYGSFLLCTQNNVSHPKKQSAFESSTVSDALLHLILKEGWHLLPILSSEYSPCLSRAEESE